MGKLWPAEWFFLLLVTKFDVNLFLSNPLCFYGMALRAQKISKTGR